MFRKTILRTCTGPVFCRRNSSSFRENLSSYLELCRKHPVPISAGLLVISIVQLRRIRKNHEEAVGQAVRAGILQPAPSENFWVKTYNSLPLEAASRQFGNLSETGLPGWAKRPVLAAFCRRFGVDLEEAESSDINSYKSLGDLFRRRLKSGARKIDADAVLVSPCDGKVLHCGPVNPDGQIEQVKGVTYSLSEFLGANLKAEDGQNAVVDFRKAKTGTCLYQVTMYLAPGDYHCFHSPAQWTIGLRRHFAGKLLSVRPSVATWMPKLFSLNERVAYLGTWNSFGKNVADAFFFAFVAVGATNVGSIRVDMDGELSTNRRENSFGRCQEKSWPLRNVEKGEFFGEFNLGSTIVLVFEAPDKSFEMAVKPGDKVRVGEKLATTTP